MEIQQKPDYFIFAEDAKTGEITDFPNIKRGWGVTLEQTQGKPPLEWFNSAFNRIDKNALYLLQQGVPEWSADVLYPIGAIIKVSGNLYKATRQSANLSPDNSPNDWELFIDDASLTKKGIVKLSSEVNSTVENQAATPKAVKTAYDLANNALPLTGGTVTGNTNFTGKLQQAGNDVITTANVSSYQGLGYGQTWQDVTSSRKVNVAYTNETGKPIMLSILTSKTGGASSYFTVDGVSLLVSGNISNVAERPFSLIIPAGSTYMATENFRSWNELR